MHEADTADSLVLLLYPTLRNVILAAIQAIRDARSEYGERDSVDAERLQFSENPRDSLADIAEPFSETKYVENDCAWEDELPLKSICSVAFTTRNEVSVALAPRAASAAERAASKQGQGLAVAVILADALGTTFDEDCE